MKHHRPRPESRRRFLKSLPAGLVGTAATAAWAQQPPSPAAAVVTADHIKAAALLDGVSMSPAEEAAAVTGANNNLNNFVRLRQIEISSGIEPPLAFQPALPGRKMANPATPGRPLRLTKPPLTLRAPADLEQVAYWPLSRIAALLERRLITSTALTRMYLGRLKRYQPTLNFYVTLTEELALQQAADADRAIRQGRYRGPLHGIPWGAKDLFATKGNRTTWGAEPYVNHVPDYDATIVERLRDAGAVLVAKLSLGALAQGDRWFGGQTKNPWNPQTGSSGSSAGPASATAAGCVGFAIGTETRGSILSPALTCGVVGLRPTYGRVSRHGAMTLSWTMDKAGPLCRYVEDTMLVLNAIYGPDERDPSVADRALTWNPATPVSRMRIAYVKSAFDSVGQGGGGGGRGVANPERVAAAQAERRQMADAVLATFTRIGARLEPVALPDGIAASAQALSFILSVEAAAAFDDLTRSGDLNQLATGTSASAWPNTFRQARLVPAVEYLRAMRVRALLMRQADEFFSKYDAVLEPDLGGTLALTNLTGHPSVGLNCGFAQNHMPGFDKGQPVGFLLTGRLYDEGTLCRVALAYEQATSWKDQHPL